MAEKKPFLSRWSQRKLQVAQGVELPAESPDAKTDKKPSNKAEVIAIIDSIAINNIAIDGSNMVLRPAASELQAPEAAQLPPPPTLQEAQALTVESDFKPFMAKNVSPDVKNAAMKKLFTDPHYNVMDMMDTYVDDYSKPDPMHPEMLRELVAGKFMRLFERDEEQSPESGTQDAVRADTALEPAEEAREAADSPPAQTVAQSETRALPHDHTDLRLQPNHAAGRESPGRGAG